MTDRGGETLSMPAIKAIVRSVRLSAFRLCLLWSQSEAESGSRSIRRWCRYAQLLWRNRVSRLSASDPTRASSGHAAGRWSRLKEAEFVSKTSEQLMLVTGATGRQGGAMYRCLQQQELKLRALARDPNCNQARQLTEYGEEAFQGSLDDPDSLLRDGWCVRRILRATLHGQ